MDFDENDLLSLAIESVEKEVAESASVSNSLKEKNIGKYITNSNVSDILSEGNTVFEEDQDDILALALESVENKGSGQLSVDSQESDSQIISAKKRYRSLVDVELNFEPDPLEDADLKEKENLKKYTPEKSLVHNGDTDSSDDEDNKYFEESKYDSYGKSIKTALKEGHTGSGLLTKKQEASWKAKRSNSTFLAPEQNNPSKEAASFDPVFGIRIVNPLVSSQTIKEKMVGRNAINFMKLKFHVTRGDLKADWVIAGVLVKKYPPRVSQNGSNYSNWLLSDLKGEMKTALIFLFGRAHDDLWKTPSGTVLAILNPSVLKDNKNEYEAKLSIKSGDQVMIWGRSKDLGQCNFKKKNGENCGAFVNLSQCEFCVYHVQQEYKKFNSRSELAQLNGKSKVNLRNKVLGKNEVFYGGKSFTSLPTVGKKANPKDKDRLKGLGFSKQDTKISDEPMQVPLLQRSNKMFNLLNSGNTSLPNKITDEKRLSSLTCNKTTGAQIENKFTGMSNVNKATITLNEKKSTNKIKERKVTNPLSDKETTNDMKTKLKHFPDVKLNTPPSLKKPLLSNPEEQISFDLEITGNKTPSFHKDAIPVTVKNSQKSAAKQKLQKRFNSLVSMTSSVSDSDVKPQLPFILPKNTMLSPLASTKSAPKINTPQSEMKEKSSTPKPNKVIHFQEQVVKNNNNPLGKNETNLDETVLPVISDCPAVETLNVCPIIRPGQRPIKSQKLPPNAGMSRAKLQALQYIKEKGPIKKGNPTGKDSSKRGLKRPSSPSSEVDTNEKPVLSERFLQLMNQKSIHEDLIEAKEMEQEMEYFDKMEKKDRLEEKMLSTYKVDCKAVRCVKCNYIWFSAADACKAEGHPIKVVDAVKRFFKCGKCSNRTISLTIIPLIPCRKCFSSNWVRAPMIREKIAKNESLSIRGGEQKYVNSGITNGSLDLLVPD